MTSLPVHQSSEEWSKGYGATDCGADGYPAAWHETIKHAVRDAAGNRCVRCGHPYMKGAGEWSPCDTGCLHGGPIRHHAVTDEGDDWTYVDDAAPLEGGAECPVVVLTTLPGVTVHARWRILTVHHLDGDKTNCRWWNLAALCQRCHLQIQGKVDMRRVYPWPHSDWFKPYVAGYYAWAYLREEISREEAERRLDELLALELAVCASDEGERSS